MEDFFKQMLSEFLQETTQWQWWVSQAFALISIIFCITAMQQKKRTNILWHRSLYSLLLFAGVCFLGEISAMIMVGVGFLRTFVLLLLSYRTKNSDTLNWVVFALLATVLVVLNFIFWENYLNILGIAVGLTFLFAFIQEKPATIRRVSIAAASIAIVFYTLLFSPVNALINLAVLISSIVGLFRLDKKKKVSKN